jgi:MFS family permease
MALGQVLPYLVLLPLVLGYLFLQISDDVATGPYAALVPDLVPEEHRGRIGGVMSLLQLGAQIVAAVVGIALSASPFLIYVVIAAINIVCAAIVWFSARERGLEVPPSARPITAMENEPGLAAKMMRGVQEWTAPWRGHDFRWVWITRFLNALGWSIIVIYVSNYLNDVVKVFSLPGGILLKDSLHAAIVIALIISLSGAVSALYAGKMADKIGRKRVMLLSGWLMFAALVPFALYPNYTAIAVLALLFGIGYGAYISASWAIAADVLPSKEDSGKDMGIWQMSVVVPQFITGMIGALIDRGNEGQEGFGFTLAFLFAAAAFLAAGLLVRKVRGSS